MGDAIIFHGVCDHIGTGAHLRQSIAHSHTDTGQLQHFQIVFGISKGNGFLRGDTDCRTQACSISMRASTQLAYILSFARKMQLQFFFCKNCFKADRSPAGMGVSRTICPCSSQSWPFI